MGLRECLDKTGIREFTTWAAWKEAQWNKQDRTTWYLMQIAAEIQRSVLSGADARKVKTADYKIPFVAIKHTESQSQKAKLEHQKNLDDLNKQRWFFAVGLDRHGQRKPGS